MVKNWHNGCVMEITLILFIILSSSPLLAFRTGALRNCGAALLSSNVYIDQSIRSSEHCKPYGSVQVGATFRRRNRPQISMVSSAADAVKTAFYSIPKVPDGEVELEVIEGRIPEWLRGSLFRNGPGLFSAGSQNLEHLFDGYALLNKFDFREDGKVYWRAAFLQSDAYKAARDGRMRFHEFGTSAGSNFWSKTVGIARAVAGEVTDNACVSIQRLEDGTMLALTESVRGTFEFDENTLETGERLEWRGDQVGQLNTAHPLPDGNGRHSPPPPPAPWSPP